jgi:hypothetical protein
MPHELTEDAGAKLERAAETHVEHPQHPDHQHQGKPGEGHQHGVDRPLALHDPAIQDRDTGDAHQAD